MLWYFCCCYVLAWCLFSRRQNIGSQSLTTCYFGQIRAQHEVQGTNQHRGNCESSGPLQSGATGGLCAGVSPKLNMDSFTISDILRFTDMDISRFIPDPRRWLIDSWELRTSWIPAQRDVINMLIDIIIIRLSSIHLSGLFKCEMQDHVKIKGILVKFRLMTSTMTVKDVPLTPHHTCLRWQRAAGHSQRHELPVSGLTQRGFSDTCRAREVFIQRHRQYQDTKVNIWDCIIFIPQEIVNVEVNRL